MISPNRKKRIPRVFIHAGKSLDRLSSELLLLEYNDAYTLDAKASYAINARSEVYQDVVYRYIAYFNARGYSRID